MKKSFLYALVAAVYIVFIVNVTNMMSSVVPEKTILIPMTILGLFVLSAAIMGFLFLFEPITLYIDGKKEEAMIFFAKIVGFFACFVTFFIILLFVL